MNGSALDEYEGHTLWPNWFLEFRDNPAWKQSRVFFPLKSILETQLMARCKFCLSDVIIFNKIDGDWKYNTIRMAYHKRSCKKIREELQEDEIQ